MTEQHLADIINKDVLAVFIARIMAGLLFFFQGLDAVFKVKVSFIVETIRVPLQKKGVPYFLIIPGAYYTSYIKLVAGFCLLIGFAKYYALYLLGFDLIVASIAFGMIKAVWDMQYVFPRLFLVLFLLVVPSEWDVLSVDYVWSVIKFIRSII